MNIFLFTVQSNFVESDKVSGLESQHRTFKSWSQSWSRELKTTSLQVRTTLNWNNAEYQSTKRCSSAPALTIISCGNSL